MKLLRPLADHAHYDEQSTENIRSALNNYCVTEPYRNNWYEHILLMSKNRLSQRAFGKRALEQPKKRWKNELSTLSGTS